LDSYLKNSYSLRLGRKEGHLLTGLAKVAVSFSADTFMVNQSLVLRINPDSYRDGKNRHLCQAPKRCNEIQCCTAESLMQNKQSVCG
jgi:hypothetical protein